MTRIARKSPNVNILRKRRKCKYSQKKLPIRRFTFSVFGEIYFAKRKTVNKFQFSFFSKDKFLRQKVHSKVGPN